MNKLLLLFFALLVFLPGLRAQQSIESIEKAFFQRYQEDPLQAVDYAFSSNPWMSRNLDGIDNLKNQLDNLLKLIGDYHGYEFLTQEQAGERFVLRSFLLRYDRQPLRFTFTYYKPNDSWRVQNFQYDDNLDEELEEAAKLSK